MMLASLIGCFILFLVWSARMASTGGTDITDRDYYSKGLKYNSTLVEKKAASVIGWQLKTRLTERKLTFTLVDKNNQPILAAHGTLELPEPGGNHALSIPLEEINPGNYHVELPLQVKGERLARVDFERDGARISRQLLLNIPSGSEIRQNE